MSPFNEGMHLSVHVLHKWDSWWLVLSQHELTVLQYSFLWYDRMFGHSCQHKAVKKREIFWVGLPGPRKPTLWFSLYHCEIGRVKGEIRVRWLSTTVRTPRSSFGLHVVLWGVFGGIIKKVCNDECVYAEPVWLATNYKRHTHAPLCSFVQYEVVSHWRMDNTYKTLQTAQRFLSLQTDWSTL